MAPKIIPVNYIPEAWESGLRYILKNGKMLDGERGKTLTVFNMTCYIKDPLYNMVHPKSIYNEIFLEEYANQLINGIKLPKNQEFDYNYHDRIFNYDNGVNQIEYCIEKLKENKYTRRAIFNTGIPFIDNTKENIPCLVEGGFYFDGDYLNFDCKMRSWDFYGASPANLYAFAYLLKYVATEVKLIPGSLNVTGRIPHIYKYDIKNAYKIAYNKIPLIIRLLNINNRAIRDVYKLP